MGRTAEEIKKLYRRVQSKKREQGRSYNQTDFLRDIGITRPGTFSDWTSGRSEPGLQSEMLMDVLEERELS